MSICGCACANASSGAGLSSPGGAPMNPNSIVPSCTRVSDSAVCIASEAAATARRAFS
jgi:hypothetical protein